MLIAGERRLLACKQLGWRDVPVTIVNIAKIARGEYAENVERKNFTLSEAVAIKREIEPEETLAAKERQAAAGPTKGRGAKATGVGKFHTPVRHGIAPFSVELREATLP